MGMKHIRQQILISGIGGQGILFLTRLLAQSALEMGLEVITSETHGMAVRGGSVASHVKVGGFYSPLIRGGAADVLLALDRAYVNGYLPFLKEGGTIILNSPGDERWVSIDATGVSARMGIPRMSNIVLLGFALARKALFCRLETVERAMAHITPQRYLEANLQALRAGFSRGLG
jgi:indolepyruvate ferredoxin oxidoreductase beta subunit